MVSFDMQLSAPLHRRVISFLLRWRRVPAFCSARIYTCATDSCALPLWPPTTPPPQTPLRNYADGASWCGTPVRSCLFSRNVTQLPDRFGHFGNGTNPSFLDGEVADDEMCCQKANLYSKNNSSLRSDFNAECAVECNIILSDVLFIYARNNVNFYCCQRININKVYSIAPNCILKIKPR